MAQPVNGRPCEAHLVIGCEYCPEPPSTGPGQPASHVNQDGSAWLSPDDLRAVSAALYEAAEWTDSLMRKRYLRLAEQLRATR